jgi:hypothetical protein
MGRAAFLDDVQWFFRNRCTALCRSDGAVGLDITFHAIIPGLRFVALAFAVTPMLGAFVFAEPISIRLVIGIGLVFCGLLFVAG